MPLDMEAPAHRGYGVLGRGFMVRRDLKGLCCCSAWCLGLYVQFHSWDMVEGVDSHGKGILSTRFF